MKEQKIMPSKNPCRYARYAEIILYEDASGWQTFKYGKLGELTENIRTFALPFENQTYTFKMNFEYDSWNRIQDMTYPDGEVVHYDYNRGGMLEKVAGHKDGMPYQYLDSIVYNEFEQRSEVFHGNGTHTLYVYDSLRRLLLLQSQTHAGDIMQDILYTYDSVSNITNITNSAGMLPNGLGGTYNSAYTYDDLYRLTSSTGGWQGSQNISYRTTTLYRGNGRIKQKNLAARTLLNGVSDTVNYSHYYYYGNTSQPNTLTRYSSSVWDPGSWLSLSNEEDSQFGWDAAGNMTESCIGGDRNCRSLCWDEQNRLQGVRDNKWLSYYQYDAAGDRTYKLTGKGELQNINGEWRYFYHLDNATLYASPYLVATRQGYTKHYYADAERIASRIGGGRLRYLDQPVVGQGKIVEKQSTNKTYAKEVLEECLDAIHSEGQADLHHLYDMINSAHSETDCYWYHPDHLGSSSWITDSAGAAVQHLHYLPWGEDFVNQRSSSWNAMYTFSAKEKDTETGYSYFGARYYSSDLSIWLSVDPMSDKYPSLSPYVYCSNNPVKLVDPNGEDITKFEDVNGNLIKQIDDGSNAVFRQFGNRKGMHYEFTGFDESQGGKNEVNLGTAIQEQQQLNNNNTYLKENGGVTYCNIATQNVMKTVASVPGFEKALVTGNANEMYDAMDNNANFVSVSKSQAIKFGKKGLAIVAYKNTKGGPGHVATFSAGTNEGEVANIGPAEYTGFTTVNGAIATTKAKKYFIFRPGYISKPIQVE